MSGRLVSPKNWDWILENLETRFGPRNDLGLKMVPGCFTCMLNCSLRCCEAGSGYGFLFQRSGTEVDEGVVHGQPTHYFLGLLKTVPNCVLDRKSPCEFA